MNNEKVGRTGYVSVIDNTGMTIAHPDASLVMKNNILETDGMKAIGKEMVSGATGISHYHYRGVAKVAGYAPVKSTGWSIMLAMAESEYLATANDVQFLLIIIAASSSCHCLRAVSPLCPFHHGPLTRGVAFAQTVASGDFTQELQIDQRDEIGMLAHALNGMSLKLSEMIATVQQNARAARRFQRADFLQLDEARPRARRTRPPAWRRRAPRWRSSLLPWSRWPNTRNARPPPLSRAPLP